MGDRDLKRLSIFPFFDSEIEYYLQEMCVDQFFSFITTFFF